MWPVAAAAVAVGFLLGVTVIGLVLRHRRNLRIRFELDANRTDDG